MEIIIADEKRYESYECVSRPLFIFWLQTILDKEYPDKIAVEVADHGDGAYVGIKKHDTTSELKNHEA